MAGKADGTEQAAVAFLEKMYRLPHGFPSTWEDLISRASSVDKLFDEYPEETLVLEAYNGHLQVLKTLYNDKSKPLFLKVLFPSTPEEAKYFWQGGTLLHTACARLGNLAMIRWLIDVVGVDQHKHNDMGVPPVYIATAFGCLDALLALNLSSEKLKSARSTHPSRPELDGQTLLHPAAINGRVLLIHHLLERGVDPAVRNKDGCSAPVSAAINGQFDALQCFYHKNYRYDPKKATDDDKQVFLMAAAGGHNNMLRWLMSRGWPTNLRDKQGFSGAYLAALGGHIKTISLLRPSPAALRADCVIAPGVPMLHNQTLLHATVRNNQVEAAKQLLKQGVDRFATNALDHTPAHLAAAQDKLALFQVLCLNLDHYNEYSKRNPRGDTLSHFAMAHKTLFVFGWLRDTLKVPQDAVNENGFTIVDCAAFMLNLTALQQLCTQPADFQRRLHCPKKPDYHQRTLLHTACSATVSGADPTLVVQWLLANGVDPKARNARGYTAVCCAVAGAYLSVVQLLCPTPAQCQTERTVYPTTKRLDNCTLLHVAAGISRIDQPQILELVHWLIQQALDITACNTAGDTALHIAAEFGSLEMFQLLWETAVQQGEALPDVADLLYRTAKGDNKAVATHLLCEHPDALQQAKEKHGCSMAYVAALEGSDKVLASLQQKPRTPYQDDRLHQPGDPELDKQTLLHAAVIGASEACVRFLIKQGVDPQATNAAGISAITLAVLLGRTDLSSAFALPNTALQNYRIEAPTFPELHGGTLLHAAVASGELAAVKWALDKKIDRTVPNAAGRTPAYEAVRAGHLDMLKKLCPDQASCVAARIDKPNNPNWHQRTLLHAALFSADPETRKEMITWLLKRGVDPGMPDARGFTPRYLAARMGLLAVLKQLCPKREDYKERFWGTLHPDVTGRTLLHAALDEESNPYNRETIEWLLAEGRVDPTLTTTSGLTAPALVTQSQGYSYQTINEAPPSEIQPN